ncbi:MAG TPA: caspase family protein [Thermoflexales bacterium]|nr:caspase family protein [Thermoflexales bacterium]HQZ99801.1 caspase family protein [Thermoflexales bacterium]
MMNTFEHGYALLIGVGDHKSDPGLSLPVTAKDVAALRKTLLTPDLCGYMDDKDHVRVLSDEEATNSNIVKGLKWLKSKAESDSESTIFVYFSGHGFVSPDEEYFLVTQDTDATDTNSIKDTALHGTAFTNQLRAITAKRLLVVLDCCHAQGMAEAKDLPQIKDDVAKGLKQGQTAVTNITVALAQGQGRAVFSSSQGDESSYWLRNGSMSIFTYHFIEALQGAGQQAGDTEVTISSLMKYVAKKVKDSAASERGANQNPFFNLEATDFPVALVRGGKGLPAGGWEAVKPEAERYLGTLTQNAVLTGGGAIAQGDGAIAVGQGGVYIGGVNTGSINTGTHISGDYIGGDKVLGDKIEKIINTGGGAYIGGNFTGSGNVVGRDQVVSNYYTSPPSDATANISAAGKRLAKLLNDYFSASELEGLAFEMDADWDNLPGDTKEVKAREFVRFAERRNALAELKKLVRVARPNLRGQLE